MRRVLACLAALLVSGCAGPHASGTLWALDEAHLEEETVYRVPDAQRAARARTVELGAVDDLLAADEARLQALLAACPGPAESLSEPSPGLQARAAARLKASTAETPGLRDRAGRLAQADWYLRRAAATGDPAFCQRARQSSFHPLPADESAPDQPPPDQSAENLLMLVRALPAGEVDAAVDTASLDIIDGSADPYQALVLYQLGLVDGVRGPAPLVAQLAALSGGTLHLPPGPLELADRPPEEVVDAVAPALAADWEPDGLYAALRAARQ